MNMADEIKYQAEDCDIADSQSLQQDESPSSDAPIIFKDAVGRNFTFPYDAVREWDDITNLIKEAFLHVDIIKSHVEKGHYDLANTQNEIILPQLWSRWIKPGARVSMHMWPLPDIERQRAKNRDDDSDLESQYSGTTTSSTLIRRFRLRLRFYFTFLEFLRNLAGCAFYILMVAAPMAAIMIDSQLKWQAVTVGVSASVFAVMMSMNVVNEQLRIAAVMGYVATMLMTVAIVRLGTS